MSRVRTNIVVNGQNRWTLFDTGSRNTYIVADAVGDLPRWEMPQPEKIALGGKVYRITHICILAALVGGLWVKTHARIVDELGYDEDGKRIEILFGALAMQEWGIRPLPDEEKLDMTHYPKEFVEY